ncbi:MAG: AraC family transcriptional regulator [Oscillospiraceae bacterium]|nr:AraC family transcriptional regulator [Oscillospiraceae bacterium]
METICEKAATVDGVTAPVECLDLKKRSDSPDLYAHFHDYVELLYLYDGKLRVWLNGKEYAFNEGELIIINSKESHRLESAAPESRYYVIKFNPEILWASNGSAKETRYVLPFLNSSSTHPRVFPASFVSEAGIGALVADAVSAWKNRPVGYELLLRGDVLKIFGHVVGCLSDLGVEIKYTVGSGSLYGIMDNIIDYVNQNFTSCDERELAKRYKVSYSYFSRTFKQMMNMSFKEYINYLRINEAQRLLLTTGKSITDISMEMGFSSPSHFINVFRRHMGRAPKQYRKNIAKTDTAE